MRYRPDSDIFSWKDFLSLTSRLSQHGGSNPLSRFYVGIRMVRNAEKNYVNSDGKVFLPD